MELGGGVCERCLLVMQMLVASRSSLARFSHLLWSVEGSGSSHSNSFCHSSWMSSLALTVTGDRSPRGSKILDEICKTWHLVMVGGGV